MVVEIPKESAAKMEAATVSSPPKQQELQVSEMSPRQVWGEDLDEMSA